MIAEFLKNNEKPVIVIAGPTCSGKTAMAIAIADTLGTEIISADSRQVYRKLDIGTAKPSAEQLLLVKHHLIDILDPTESYNAGLFEKHASATIDKLHANGKVPIVAGGTGLYLRALMDGIIDIEIAEELHLRLMEELNQTGNEAMYQFLQKLDPEAAATMLPQNWKRVIRALEVKLTTGDSILKLHLEQGKARNYNFMVFGLLWEREDLYNRIDKRVDEMIKSGLFDEVRILRAEGLHTGYNALNTVGYKEVFQLIEGKIDETETIRLIKRNTRHYAKRQMTWFRADERIFWLPVNEQIFPSIQDKLLEKLKNF